MKIIDFIKGEFKGWTKSEAIFVPILLLTILGISISLKDNIIATISAVFGLSYTILAGKGKISCYFLGIIGTLCYSFLSFNNALWGNLLLYAGYYFPMEIIGIFAWKKNLKKDKQEIIKTSLNKKQQILLPIILVICTIFTYFVFLITKDKSPLFDAITTVFSVAGMYLTVKRCIEQWIIWIIVNAIASVMWLKIFLTGENVFATFLMWFIYLFLGIYFFFKWKNEMK